ncbi:cell growth-regulating nucleolar protein [Photinus pyralis]|nr:cell growth-regulating nucleolar protein [Photinus pyralis]
MVVFTCNNCGDSLQKPKVEKHYVTACRGVKNLTCVDCLNDFRGEEYATHTKCITEQERYSAKGSVTNVVGKGEAKQQQWSDMINEIIHNTKPMGAQKCIFQIISNQTQNVPRKKMKFINFIKSSSGNKVQNPDIEAVWDLIEKHKADASASVNAVDLTTAKPPTEEATKTDAVENSSPQKKKKSNHSESDTVSNTISPQDDGSEGKKKKKKSENVTPITTTKLPVNGSEGRSSQDGGGEGMKKKKRKPEIVNIAPITTSNSGNLLLNGNEQISLQDDGREEKKKKKRRLNTITTTNGHDNSSIKESEENTKKRKSDTVISEVNSSDIHADTHLDKKKRKMNNVPEKSIVSESSVQENSKPNDSISKKKKKQNQENTEVKVKKAKLDANGSTSKEKKKGKPQTGAEDINGPEAVVSADEPKLNGNDSSLTDSLILITLKKLQKKNSLRFDKLQKKVLAEYCKETNVRKSPKLVKQFKKKLRKMKGVEIVNDNVTLKTFDRC